MDDRTGVHSQMRRRDVIKLLGGAAAWPLVAHAQQPVIGWLNTTTAQAYADRARAFLRGLRDAGYVEKENIAIEYRWADDQFDRLPALAADLVRRKVDAIFTNGVPATGAAKAATKDIPIVFVMGADPVTSGFVQSLNRPGGNITGVSTLAVELGPKQLELLHELVPTATAMGFVINPTHPNADTVTRNVQAAAATLRLRLHVAHARTERDFENAFATLAALKLGGALIANEALFNGLSEQLAALAARHGMPAVHAVRDFATSGGLMSYGPSVAHSYRLAGSYVAQILKGEKSADLPVQQSTKVDFVLNLKTAKAHGLTVSLPLLGRADEVIE